MYLGRVGHAPKCQSSPVTAQRQVRFRRAVNVGGMNTKGVTQKVKPERKIPISGRDSRLTGALRGHRVAIWALALSAVLLSGCGTPPSPAEEIVGRARSGGYFVGLPDSIILSLGVVACTELKAGTPKDVIADGLYMGAGGQITYLDALWVVNYQDFLDRSLC